MKLSTSLVAVKKLTASSSRLDFDSEQIEQLAQQILKAEGIISPLIVHRTSLQSYEVVEGHFEYHAAARAREIDPRKGEMISVYIIEPENDHVSEAITEQIELLKRSRSLSYPDQRKSVPLISKPEEDQTTKDFKSLMTKVVMIEKTLVDLFSPIKNIQNLVNEIQISTSNLVSYNQLKQLLDEHILVANQALNSLSNNQVPPANIDQDSILHDLNTLSVAELHNKILKAGCRTKASDFAQGIYNGRQSQHYRSISDVKVAGLGKATMKKIVDNW